MGVCGHLGSLVHDPGFWSEEDVDVLDAPYPYAVPLLRTQSSSYVHQPSRVRRGDGRRDDYSDGHDVVMVLGLRFASDLE